MPLTHDISHAAESQALLLAQFQGAPKLAALIAAHAARYQGLEDALWTLTSGMGLTDAVAAQIVGIGKILALLRPLSGLAAGSDTSYRYMLQAAVQAHISNGQPGTLIAILALLQSQRTQYIELSTAFPSQICVRMAFKGTLVCDNQAAMNLLLVPAGPASVRLILSGNEVWWPDRTWSGDDLWPVYSYTDGLWNPDYVWRADAFWGGDMMQ